jgi:hypothetical protein
MGWSASRFLAALAAAAIVAAPVAAQAGAPQDVDPEKIAKAIAEATKDKKEEKLPELEKFVEGMEKIEGLFTLYRKKDDLYAFIPKKFLEKPMYLATSVAAGPGMAGFQGPDWMVEFHRRDNRIFVIQPDTFFRAKEKGPIHKAVTLQHPGIIKAALTAKAEQAGGVLIDLTDLYVKGAEAFIGFIARGKDPSLAQINKVKNFPQNVEVAFDLVTRIGGGSAGPSLPFMPASQPGEITTVHYSLSALPEQTAYVPRIADDRIGYFLTVAKDYDVDYRDETNVQRFVNRWNLEKADPSLALSPPKEPIVFYVEKTVPTRFQRWVQEGIEEWNKAYEKVGFVNAIIARQQTDSQFNDLDPEDVRYNFFRWITSDVPFAMGPSRVDPRTGQILDADIIFDDSMVRAYVQDWDLMVEEAILESFSPADERFLAENPEWNPLRHLPNRRVDGKVRGASELLSLARNLHDSSGAGVQEPFGSGRKVCGIGRGHSRQMALAALHFGFFASARDDKDGKKKEREWPEEFVGQVVKEIVMHEVGHTLGLRHNFKASSWRSFAEFNPADGKVEDLSASVMDYNPLNIVPKGSPQGRYVMTTIGPYDIWAIEYGYKPIPGGKPEAEKEELAKIAARCAEPGHDYATDEDIYLADPLTNRWDYGKDTLEFLKSRCALVEHLQKEALDRVIDEGESYAAARGAIMTLLAERGQVCTFGAAYVGGYNFSRDHRGDPGARDPIVFVPPAKQREALQLLRDRIFAAEAFELPPDLLRKLAPSRWSYWGTPFDVEPETEAAFPYHDLVLALQTWTLRELMSPGTIRRLADGEVATPTEEEALTIPELLTALTDTIFAEIPAADRRGRAAEAATARRFTNRNPFVESIRRNLQREYVGRLIALALATEVSAYPRPARTLAWYHLRNLKGRIDGSLEGGAADRLDEYTRAHLEESRERIARALEATFTIPR